MPVPEPSQPEPSPEPYAEPVPRLRGVHRAVAELRRGTPVILDAAEPFVVLAAETAGAAGLREFMAIAAAPPVLMLSPLRAAALLRRPVQEADRSLTALGFRTGALDSPGVLLGLADPTAAQLLADPPALVAAPDAGPAALALVKLARLLPAALISPIRHASAGLLRVPAGDVLAHPDREAAALVRVAEAAVPLEDARDARVIAFRAPDAGIEHLAIVIGRPDRLDPTGPAPLVRVHSECFTGDLLGSLRCDCGPQLRGALARMGAEGAGAVLYLAQEGRGIGLASKLRAYALQDRGLDTLDANRALGWQADERNFWVAATMLRELGLPRIRLLTNNPDKVRALEACGVEITGREGLVVAPNGVNDHYLATKARRFGHLLG